MSDSSTSVGSIVWQDLTVPDAEQTSAFYANVVGWKMSPHDMGEYHDFNVQNEQGEVVAGICHARGSNASIPPQWLLYVKVVDVDRSAQQCKELGGTVVDGPRLMGGSKFCVIQDPAGAFLALVE